MQPVLEAERLSILNRAITILAEDAKDEGAPSQYSIRVQRPSSGGSDTVTVDLRFQRGAVGRDGANINGISDESLMEVLIHRLKAFQAGKWASETNAAALSHLQQALSALQTRTTQRRAAGVEGTTNVMPGERGHSIQR